MFAVYKREFRAYMSNVYGWMFMAVLLLFVGFMVFRENLSTGVPYLEYALLGSKYVLFLMIPILCMRSMAEDRRNKTDMFYLSLPLRTRSVVVGKYLALLTVYAIPCAVIAVYPVLLRVFGVVNFAGAYSSLLSFFLLGAALIAVCQFLSALTDNLVVAAVLGVLGCLLLFALTILAYILPSAPIVSYVGILVLALLAAVVAYLSTRSLMVTIVTAAVLVIPASLIYVLEADVFRGLLPAFLERVALFAQFDNVSTYGWLSIPSLVLFLSYPVFFVFLTIRAADRKRFA